MTCKGVSGFLESIPFRVNSNSRS
uniref:Uncharacterized protein n=1 Tax=Anguilla anguilla TaxID=7936 RepID=A0A0E9XY49_ANGAN